MVQVDADSFNKLVADFEVIKKAVMNIQSMIDPGTILTEDDLSAITAYEKEKAGGALIPFEKLKNELLG